MADDDTPRRVWPQIGRLAGVAGAVAIALAACTTAEPPPEAPPGPGDDPAFENFTSFHCKADDAAQGETVFTAFVDGGLVLTRDGLTARFEPAVAASGARFTGSLAGTPAAFWTKGDAATFTVGGTRRACTENAPTPGVVFRASGNEPGWMLTLASGRMEMRADYGAVTAITPLPAPETDGNTVTYAAETEAHTLVAVVRRERCSDTMSGRLYPNAVAVTLNGRMFTGCGGPPVR